jgi:broad specificity polyphosphatase/5'/3'-nucleotidase SurE
MSYSPTQAERRITAMESAFEDANVTGYESLAVSMTNDPKDRHVLAAAVRCAHAIVTSNVKHFPTESVKPYNVNVLTPDEFLMHQFHLNQELLMEKIGQQARARGVSTYDLLRRLGGQAPGFATCSFADDRAGSSITKTASIINR